MSEEQIPARAPGVWFTATIVVVMAVAMWSARDLPSAARIFPMAVAAPAFVFALVQLVFDIKGRVGATQGTQLMDVGHDASIPRDIAVPRAFRAFLWLGALIALSILFGFRIALPLFVSAYLRFVARAGWALTLAITVGIVLLMFGLFDTFLGLPLPRGFARYWFA